MIRKAKGLKVKRKIKPFFGFEIFLFGNLPGFVAYHQPIQLTL